MKKNKRLITSALPYVNNIPHLGNIAGAVLSADVFYRYCKLNNFETIYICGTDEYGTTTETRAAEEHLTPKEICDKYHTIHKEIYDWFSIDFSYFGRTSEPCQTEIVQDIFFKLYNNGYIKEGVLIQPFCESCDRALADRYVYGTCPHCGYVDAKGDQCDNCGKLLDPIDLKDPKCSTCGNTPVFKETKHLFLDLEKLKPELKEWFLKTSKEDGWANNAITITKASLESKVPERCITRDLKWGVPVPLKGYEDKVFYVWFDAPIGYISITSCYLPFEWKEWWHNPENVDLYQFMGKDNIPFHTLIFPSSLIGARDNYTMLKYISSTEYINYEGQKFSKSRGTGVFGNHAKETGIDSDLFRYYLMRNRPEKNDTNFYWDDFMDKVNGEIIANYANLVNRVLQFVEKFFDFIIPEFDPKSKTDTVFEVIDIKDEKKKVVELFENMELKNTLLYILQISTKANKYFQDKAPWEVIKSDKVRAGKIIGSLTAVVKDLTIFLSPYIPKTASNVMKILNLDPEIAINFDNIGSYNELINRKIEKPYILFKKLEDKQMHELKIKYAGNNEDIKMVDPFSKIVLKVGKIIEINRHPKADKLYIEKVDMGNGEIRQIVSGLVPYYKEEELLNKKIIVVYNLKSATLRGELSQGMVLAAETEDGSEIELLTADVPLGTTLSIKGVFNRKEEISIDEFKTCPIIVKDNSVYASSQPLIAGEFYIKTEKIKDGNVR